MFVTSSNWLDISSISEMSWKTATPPLIMPPWTIGVLFVMYQRRPTLYFSPKRGFPLRTTSSSPFGFKTSEMYFPTASSFGTLLIFSAAGLKDVIVPYSSIATIPLCANSKTASNSFKRYSASRAYSLSTSISRTIPTTCESSNTKL